MKMLEIFYTCILPHPFAISLICVATLLCLLSMFVVIVMCCGGKQDKIKRLSDIESQPPQNANPNYDVPLPAEEIKEAKPSPIPNQANINDKRQMDAVEFLKQIAENEGPLPEADIPKQSNPVIASPRTNRNQKSSRSQSVQKTRSPTTSTLPSSSKSSRTKSREKVSSTKPRPRPRKKESKTKKKSSESRKSSHSKSSKSAKESRNKIRPSYSLKNHLKSTRKKVPSPQQSMKSKEAKQNKIENRLNQENQLTTMQHKQTGPNGKQVDSIKQFDKKSVEKPAIQATKPSAQRAKSMERISQKSNNSSKWSESRVWKAGIKQIVQAAPQSKPAKSK